MISSLVFLVLFINLYQNELAQERTNAAVQVNRLLQTSLENAMLKRDLDGLREILNHLGQQPGVLAVSITNPAGEIRFSSAAALLGRFIQADSAKLQAPSTQWLEDQRQQGVLRSINPVRNKPACLECHGPADSNPLNGILYVDYDAEPLRNKARDTTLLLMSSGALIVLINLLGGWWFIQRYVIHPLEQLAQASQRLAHGDLDARAQLRGRDELAKLGSAFNEMAENLQIKVRELQEKEQFLQELIDAIPDGLRIIDADFQVILSNQAYRRQLGQDERRQAAERCYEFAHQRSTPCPSTLITCPLEEMRRNEAPLRVVHRHRRENGQTLEVEIYAAPMHVTRNGKQERLMIESIRDLELQVKFSHEQKLSELGRLAAGVAHEIHNPLASVRLALHAAQQANHPDHPDSAQIQTYLELVDQEIDKCIQVTERLLKLSVPPPAQAELVELDRVLDDTLKLLFWEAETRGASIQLEIPGERPYRIMATDSEMRMLSLNLAQNALHAMVQGGVLQVICAREEDKIRIIFSDNGCGIAPNDMRHIFNPFFSRRADGVRGTGLGLSISKAIVDNYGGDISVESMPGVGSRFTLRFPDADTEAET